MKKRTITTIVFSSLLLLSACDESPEKVIVDFAVSKARVELANLRMHDEMTVAKQQLALLQQVKDLESLQKAETDIDRLRKEQAERRKQQRSLGRLTHEEEQQLDKDIRDEYIKVMKAIMAEKQRFAEIDGIEEHYEKQGRQHRNKTIATLYNKLSEQELTDKKTISENPSAYLKLIHELQDDWKGNGDVLDQAKNKIDQYLTLRPEDSAGYCALARYYINHAVIGERQDENKALTAAEHASEIDPNNGYAHVLKAAVYLNWKMLSEARTALDKAGSLKTTSPWFTFHQVTLADLEGDKTKREALLLDLLPTLESKPLRARAYTHLAHFSLEEGNLQKSLDYHQQAVELQPGFRWRHGNYANDLLHLAGDIEKAESEGRIAARLGYYGNLNRLFRDIEFIKWARLMKQDDINAANQLFNASKPPKREMEEMMVRTGLFRHTPTVILLVKTLGKHGISVNVQDEHGETAMHQAAREGHVKTLDILLRHGASIELVSQYQQTPLTTAIQDNQPAAALYLVRKGADIQQANELMGITPLHLAVMKGMLPVVKEMINRGADVNAAPKNMGSEQETALTTAVLSGQLSMVKLLIEAGARTEVKPFGRTLTEAATELGHKDVAAYLATLKKA